MSDFTGLRSSLPPCNKSDRWEHRDGRGRAPRANGSDIPFSAIPPDLRCGKGVNVNNKNNKDLGYDYL